MTEEIDFEALFKQLQTENEGLRLRIVKLKNEEVSFFDWVKDKVTSTIESDYFQIYFYTLMMILVFIIVPIFKALFIYLLRRFSRHEG